MKRVTETSEEVRRKRSPRFLTSDGVVRNYNERQADGWKYLRELEKGTFYTLSLLRSLAIALPRYCAPSLLRSLAIALPRY